MKKSKWIYYAVAGFLGLVYFAGEATGLFILTMPIILPLGCCVIWNLNPDKPTAEKSSKNNEHKSDY